MRLLGLFAKQPMPGRVKTRLAAQTSPEWAAEVAAAFLHDLIDRLTLLDVQRVLAFAPSEARAHFENLVQGRFLLHPQAGADLGERLAGFVTHHLHGEARIVVVGTDSPTIPLEYIEQAFRELERADVVLGPATDGGYYLVGCARRLPPIFDGISWSSSSVLDETVARLSDSTWRLALLPPWYDVDTADDWQMLCGHLAAMRRAGVDPGVPRTERLSHSPTPSR